MAIKHYEIDGIGKIRVQKRRGSKSMRLRISNDGVVTVGVPFWMPYKTALDYAKKQKDWIIKHRPAKKILTNNQLIGRHHTLKIKTNNTSSFRVLVGDDSIVVYVPIGYDDESHDHVQKAAVRGARKALKHQSGVLSERLSFLADMHGYKFKSHDFKFMKSKWGSCNNEKHITLNYRLLDLPDHLVDYVLIHELVHLNHMNHGDNYWEELSSIIPNHKQLRKEMRAVRLNW